MTTPFIGEIRMFGNSFPPVGWAQTDGQLLAIAQNSAMFAVLGVTYGGNGATNFQLPDLRGRTPIHFGTGPGLPIVVLAQQGGAANHTLLSTEMPAHSHGVAATTAAAPGTAISPDGALPANAGHQPYRSGSVSTVAMKTGMVGSAGGAQPHNNMQPYTVVNFCIALQGIFPSRN